MSRTNHLDIASKEILENALVHYTGTVLYVSHDRYFINKTATRILDLTMGTLINYIGNLRLLSGKGRRRRRKPIWPPPHRQPTALQNLPEPETQGLPAIRPLRQAQIRLLFLEMALAPLLLRPLLP